MNNAQKLEILNDCHAELSNVQSRLREAGITANPCPIFDLLKAAQKLVQKRIERIERHGS